MGPSRLAGWLGSSLSTANRVIEALVLLGYLEGQYDYDTRRGCWNETIYRVNLRPGRPQTIHKPVEVEPKIDPTPGVKNDVPFNNINNSLSNTETYPPTPQGGSDVCISPPARPRGRHQHTHPPRQRQRCEGGRLSAFQVAALEVMRLCDVVETNWRIRDSIAAAIALHVEGREDLAKRAVEPMVLSWKAYLDVGDLLYCRYGIEQFFALGLWNDDKKWILDRSLKRRRL